LTGRPPHRPAERCSNLATASKHAEPKRLSVVPSKNGVWSGRRVSNPRHSAWKAWTPVQCGTPRTGPSISCPVIVSTTAPSIPVRWRALRLPSYYSG
jgi:hypothetical protein